MIDDSRNDIFIHMDAKNFGYNNESISNLVKKVKFIIWNVLL